jgi:hypothetical protein
MYKKNIKGDSREIHKDRSKRNVRGKHLGETIFQKKPVLEHFEVNVRQRQA